MEPEIHGGGTSHEADERLAHHQHPGRVTPIFNDGESSGCIANRKFIRAIPLSRLQNIQELQEEDKRGKSAQKDKQTKGGYGGNGMEQQSHERTTTNINYAANPISNYTNLRNYRPPQRGGVKRMADGHPAHATATSKRPRIPRACAPKYKSSNALPRCWTIQQFRTFIKLRATGSSCPTCTQVLPRTFRSNQFISRVKLSRCSTKCCKPRTAAR